LFLRFREWRAHLPAILILSWVDPVPWDKITSGINRKKKTMKKNRLNVALLIGFLFTAGLGCSDLAKNAGKSGGSANQLEPVTEPKPDSSSKPVKLESYSIKGIKFVYFKIPAGLKKAELIETAQKLHEQEADTQLILVDDDSQLADYISYVKAISGQGELDKPLPADWADKHIVANVQKYTSGKFVLCEGNGSIEITELK
jgi:hypothetical protein